MFVSDFEKSDAYKAFQEAFEYGGVRVRIQINGQYVYAEPITVDLINPLP